MTVAGESRFTVSSLLPALALLVVSVLWTGVLTLAPRQGQAVAAVFVPGGSFGGAVNAVLAAGADTIEAMGPVVVVARSADPDFVRRLYREGAWVVIRAGRGCLSGGGGK